MAVETANRLRKRARHYAIQCFRRELAAESLPQPGVTGRSGSLDAGWCANPQRTGAADLQRKSPLANTGISQNVGLTATL